MMRTQCLAFIIEQERKNSFYSVRSNSVDVNRVII